MRTAICLLPLLALSFILTGCGSKSFVRQPAGWKAIELREQLQTDYESAWQATVDSIARTYDIEVMDKSSGYMRTSWKFGILGHSPNQLAGRITVKYPSVKNPTRVDIKTDAKQFDGFSGYWVEGFDSTFERDILSELSGRLGRTAQ